MPLLLVPLLVFPLLVAVALATIAVAHPTVESSLHEFLLTLIVRVLIDFFILRGALEYRGKGPAKHDGATTLPVTALCQDTTSESVVPALGRASCSRAASKRQQDGR